MAMHNRVSVHLHGGHVPWPSDGGPLHWFGPGNTGPLVPGVNDPVVGASFSRWLPDTTGAMTADNWYPNDQSARLMWYHDHAVGITRLNAYAGIATAYLLTDPAVEPILIGSGALPSQQIPLVFQDKVFDPLKPGQLWYPNLYDQQFFMLMPPAGAPPVPSPSLVAEFWGDTMLVNGTAFPFVEVEPRRYRLRLLNACNTRFLSLQLVMSAGKTFPDSAEPSTAAGPIMQQIGTEGGFLDPAVAPQGALVGTARAPLVLAPAERADVIVDFSKVKPGPVPDPVQRRAGAVPRRNAARGLLPRQQQAGGPAASGFRTEHAHGPAIPGRGCDHSGRPAGASGLDAAAAGSPGPRAVGHGSGRRAGARPDAERGVRRVRPADAAAGQQRGRGAGRLRVGLHGSRHGNPGRRRDGGLADLQPDGRRAPDPLPPGQRANRVQAAVQREAVHGTEPELHSQGGTAQRPMRWAGRKRWSCSRASARRWS